MPASPISPSSGSASRRAFQRRLRPRRPAHGRRSPRLARGRSGAGRGRRSGSSRRSTRSATPMLARLAGHKASAGLQVPGAGGRSASTPRASTSPPAAAPPAPSSRCRRTTRRHGGRGSNTCSRPARAGRANPFRAGGQINAKSKSKEIQAKKLAFPWIPLVESGLFNGLQRIQIKKSSCQIFTNRSVLFAFPCSSGLPSRPDHPGVRKL